ncbi:MAG: hypothetical protein K6A32_09730 [Bacteroidales bacterium]|nr:hypothetical protein [Bacteroidales bacterium]
MTNDTLIHVITALKIRNARQFTAFLTGDKTKGVLTPYPEGYGASLWVPRLQTLREYYGANTKKERKHNKKHKNK